MAICNSVSLYGFSYSWILCFYQSCAQQVRRMYVLTVLYMYASISELTPSILQGHFCPPKLQIQFNEFLYFNVLLSSFFM